MNKYKFEKYSLKIQTLKKNQIGGNNLTPELWDEFLEIRKKIYEGFYDENGDISVEFHYSKYESKYIDDLKNFGEFVQKHNLKLDFFIGVTNSIKNLSDYHRFSGKTNTIVVSLGDLPNIFKFDPIAFRLDINDDKVIQIFNTYFKNTFTNIIVDYSTMKIIEKIQDLQFDKILDIGGKAYFDATNYDMMQYKIFNNKKFFEAYFSEQNNIPHLASDYIKEIKQEALRILSMIPRFTKESYGEINSFIYEICKAINDNLFFSEIIIDGFKFKFDGKKIRNAKLLEKYHEIENINYLESIFPLKKNIQLDICIDCNTYPIPRFKEDILSTNFDSINPKDKNNRINHMNFIILTRSK